MKRLLRSRCSREAGALRPSSSALRIFFIAATSIWRMRSALTPYSAASSCSVMPPEESSFTFSQRSSTMRRLRASSASSARAMPSPASASRRCASSTRVGSLAVVGQVGDRRVALPRRRRRSAARARCRRRTAGSPSRSLLSGLTFSSRATRSISAGVSDARCVSPSAASPLVVLHRAQVEEQLALRLGRGHLHQRQLRRMYSWISALIQCSA